MSSGRWPGVAGARLGAGGQGTWCWGAGWEAQFSLPGWGGRVQGREMGWGVQVPLALGAWMWRGCVGARTGEEVSPKLWDPNRTYGCLS